MDRDSELLIEYLRSLPRGGEVRWATHHLAARSPWTTGWVDIRLTDPEAPPSGWHWTVVSHDDPDQDDPEQLWCFAWDFDLEVHGVWDPQTHWYVNEWLARPGDDLPACIAAGYETLPERIDGFYRVRGGWSAETLSEALLYWAVGYTDRDDLRFAWDRDEPSPLLQMLAERAEQPTRDLGDGLVVAEGVMDELLTMDPGEAARLEGVFREAGKEFEEMIERDAESIRRDRPTDEG